MPYLLDTHTYVWWGTDDSRLSKRVRELLADPGNEIFFSSATAWEIAIKHQLGRLGFHDDPQEVIPRQLADAGFVSLPIELRHALFVSRLPLLHRDPFDRILVAQALVENLTLLSADTAIAQYAAPVIW